MKFIDPEKICFAEKINYCEKITNDEFLNKSNDFIEFKEGDEKNNITQLTSSRPSLKSIKIWFKKKIAYVKIESARKTDKAGCRSVGLILSAFFMYYKELPKTIYLKSNSGFQPRALLTLKYIGNPTLRKGFFDSFKEIPTDINKKKKANDFEESARNKFRKKYNCRCLKKDSLKLLGIGRKIYTDGLGIYKNQITIIEIKNLGKNFAEGVTELIQNYGIVKECIDYIQRVKTQYCLNEEFSKLIVFSHPQIKTRLIFSKEIKDEKKNLYENIMKFMGSKQKISFKVVK